MVSVITHIASKSLPEFPLLAKLQNGKTVLFSEDKVGVVIVGPDRNVIDDSDKPGRHLDSWISLFGDDSPWEILPKGSYLKLVQN